MNMEIGTKVTLLHRVGCLALNGGDCSCHPIIERDFMEGIKEKEKCIGTRHVFQWLKTKECPGSQKCNCGKYEYRNYTKYPRQFA